MMFFLSIMSNGFHIITMDGLLNFIYKFIKN